MISRAFALMLVFLAACGSGNNTEALSAKAVDGVESTSAADITRSGTDAEATGENVPDQLTGAYLEGSWCYSHFIVDDERSDEMMDYVFSADGSLLYQTNSETAVDKPGSYTIRDGHLKLVPTMRFIDLVVVTIESDAMVLKMANGQAFWRRGACAN